MKVSVPNARGTVGVSPVTDVEVPLPSDEDRTGPATRFGWLRVPHILLRGKPH